MAQNPADSRLSLLRFTGWCACLAAILFAGGLGWMYLFGERFDATLADRKIITREGRTEHRIYLEYRDGKIPRLLPLTVSREEYGKYSFKGHYPVIFMPGRPWTTRLAADHGVFPVLVIFLAGVMLLGTARVIETHVGEEERAESGVRSAEDESKKREDRIW